MACAEGVTKLKSHGLNFGPTGLKNPLNQLQPKKKPKNNPQHCINENNIINMQKFQSIKEIILRARVTNETNQIRKWEQEFLLHAEMIS